MAAPVSQQPPPFGCRFLALAGIVSFLLAAGGAVVGDRISDEPRPAGQQASQTVVQENSAVIDTVKKVTPAVVSITSTTETSTFFGPIEQKAGGTGFILTNDGLIATNRHVVEGAGASLTVITNDGRTFPAQIRALDPTIDFALIKIDARNLPVVPLGNSDAIEVGQQVVAIGNALGEFENTVTTGVISAKERSIEASAAEGAAAERLDNLLQTDAAINPGNSGGPLVSLSGQVIGINTAVAAGSAQGIGFAIPINQAKQGIDSFQQQGKISRASLGVRFVTVTPDVAALSKLPIDRGALLQGGRGGAAVLPGSAAAKVGLRDGDIITAVGTTELNEDHPLQAVIGRSKPGDEVELTYLREGKEAKVKVRLDAREEPA